MRGGLKGNEELASICIRPGVCHAHQAGYVILQVADLIIEKISRVAITGAARVTSLGREARNHTVESDAVIIALARQKDKTIGGDGRLIGMQLYRELAKQNAAPNMGQNTALAGVFVASTAMKKIVNEE